mgnify:CR=1 FL=1
MKTKTPEIDISNEAWGTIFALVFGVLFIMLLSDLNENKVTEIPELAQVKINITDSSLERIYFRRSLEYEMTPEEKQIVDLSRVLQYALGLEKVEKNFVKKVGKKYVIHVVERIGSYGIINRILVIFPTIKPSQEQLLVGWKSARNFSAWLPPVEVQNEVYDRLMKERKK